MNVLYIITFTFLESRWEDKRLNRMVAASVHNTSRLWSIDRKDSNTGIEVRVPLGTCMNMNMTFFWDIARGDRPDNAGVKNFFSLSFYETARRNIPYSPSWKPELSHGLHVFSVSKCLTMGRPPCM
jgi:hypothetical protein